MRIKQHLVLSAALTAVILLFLAFRVRPEDRFASRVVDPKRERIVLRWKDAQGHVLGNIGALEQAVSAEQQRLLFAMNGGMYMEDQRPLGLYIEEGVQVRPLITKQRGAGNFHMQPNGVFGLTADRRAFICTTADFAKQRNVHYATQSGPMLLVNGTINAGFPADSKNLNIRNGVGVRPNGEVVFCISTKPVNFHDFAAWFRDQRCTDALYLDGAISSAFIPEQGMMQRGGRLGPLIAVTEPLK